MEVEEEKAEEMEAQTAEEAKEWTNARPTNAVLQDSAFRLYPMRRPGV